MPSKVKMASDYSKLRTDQEMKDTWVCEICWKAMFETYKETLEHEQTCDNREWMMLQPAATKKSSSTNTGKEKPPQKKKPKSSKAALASLSSSSSGLEPVPLMCSITKAMAQNLPHKLHEESEMLLGNLELHQQVDAHGNTNMYIRCSNCRAHSIGLKRRAALESTMFGFKEHFFTCSSTSKNIRDLVNPQRGWNYQCNDSISEYCTCLCDLYGLVDDVTRGTSSESTVKFGECRYYLIPGYRPNTATYKAALDSVSPVTAPAATSTVLSHHITEIPSSIYFKNKLILSDHDHYVLSQFQFFCDRIKKRKVSDNDVLNGDAKDVTLQNYCSIRVCCKYCKTLIEQISTALHFVTAKPFSDHLQICHSFPTTLIDKIHDLALLKEKQLNEITSIVPLKEYTLKIIREMYMILDSKHGGMVIKSNPFPDLVAQYALSIPFIFPLIEDKWVQCSSQTDPSTQIF